MDSSSKLDCPATVNVRTVKPDFMAVTWLVSAMSHAEIEMHVNSVVFAGGEGVPEESVTKWEPRG